MYVYIYIYIFAEAQAAGALALASPLVAMEGAIDVGRFMGKWSSEKKLLKSTKYLTYYYY